MRFLAFGLALASSVVVLVACGGTTTGVNPSTDPQVTCGDGTHRCCASSGFVCVPLSTLCAHADSECTGSPPPLDASTPIDGSVDPCAGLTRCCPSGGVQCVALGAECPRGTECGVQDGGGGTDACPDITLPACWLGPSSLPCTADGACTRAGATCNTSIGACECQDCESAAFCGSVACANGLTCKSAYPGQHATCRCEPGAPGCAPPPGALGGL